MKKSIVLLTGILLVSSGVYVFFAAGQARGGMMNGGGMMGGGMMGGGMMQGNTMSNPGSEWEAPPAEGVRKNPVAASSASIEAGRALFESNCAYCHGSNARGSSIAPDLGSNDVKRQTDGDLFWKISQGKSPMPSFANTLTEHQRWDLVNFIRSLSSQSAQYSAAAAQPATSAPPVNSAMIQARLMMMNSMDRMMSGSSMVPTSDGGVIVMMGNVLLKYDNNLNLVNQVEIKFDWENWQGMMMGINQQ